MNHSTPGLPVHHHLSEFTQTHVHQVSDAIQPSHPRSSPSPPAPNPSQHQSLCQWVNSSHEVAKVLELQLHHQSFQRNPRADLLQNGLVGSPCSPRDSQKSSPTPQFKIINIYKMFSIVPPIISRGYINILWKSWISSSWNPKVIQYIIMFNWIHQLLLYHASTLYADEENRYLTAFYTI